MSNGEGESNKTIIIDGPNKAPMTVFYVFVSTDANGDGICASMIGDSWMPLVTQDADTAELLKGVARKLARESGKTVKLVKFTHRDDIWQTK